MQAPAAKGELHAYGAEVRRHRFAITVIVNDHWSFRTGLIGRTRGSEPRCPGSNPGSGTESITTTAVCATRAPGRNARGRGERHRRSGTDLCQLNSVRGGGTEPGAPIFPPWRRGSARPVETRKVLVRIQGAGPRKSKPTGDGTGPENRRAARPCRVRLPPLPPRIRSGHCEAGVRRCVSRRDGRGSLDRAVSRSKCCGDTPARHAGITGSIPVDRSDEHWVRAAGRKGDGP